MSESNTPNDALPARYLRVRSAFVAQGTTLTAWCKSNGLHIQNAHDALLGRWSGDGASALVSKVVAAAGLKEP
jgi:hypothetical protein